MKKSIWYFAKQWPRKNASAASLRTIGILKSLIKLDYDVIFYCSQKETNERDYTSNLFELNIKQYYSELNDDSIIDKFRNSPKPQFCFYDTFLSEEMFSHYAYGFLQEEYLSIVDTQDLHFLRLLRKLYSEEKFKNNQIFYNFSQNDDLKLQNKIKEFFNEHKSTFLREIATFLRCDHVIVCSDFEKLILNKILKMKDKSSIVSFFYENNDKSLMNTFELRRNVCFIGNYQHKPNRDSLLYAVNNLWDKIRKKFIENNSEVPYLEIYGVNMDHQIKQVENFAKNIKVVGMMKNTDQIRNFRLMFCPILYGAGIKGKITDSFYNSTPCISTYFGAEGITLNSLSLQDQSDTSDENSSYIDDLIKLTDLYKNSILEQNLDNWGGFYYNEPDKLVNAFYDLYVNKDIWTQKSKKCGEILDGKMNQDINHKSLESIIEKSLKNKGKDIYQRVLLRENFMSTKYLNKYINIKNNIPNSKK